MTTTDAQGSLVESKGSNETDARESDSRSKHGLPEIIDAVDRNTMEQIGEYVVRRLVGEGGMGKVYEAEERLSEKIVALKVLRSELSRSESGRRLFLNEMKILGRMDHPNIVRSLASFEHEDNLVLVLEYLDGLTLRQSLADATRLGWRRAAAIAVQVASALEGAHSQTPSVVHRDLKPDNIMLLEAPNPDHNWDIDRVKVMDFGIAKVLQELTQTHTQSVGTLQYMSPEQIDARGIDGRSDLYSLGLVLYEMISGAPPFSSPSPRELLNLQCTAKPPALDSEVRDALPDDFEPLMLRLLAKDPETRPENAGQVRKALQRMLDKAGDSEDEVIEVESDDDDETADEEVEDASEENGEAEATGTDGKKTAESGEATKKKPAKKKTAKRVDTKHLVEGKAKAEPEASKGMGGMTQMLLVAGVAFALGALVLFLIDPLGGRRDKEPTPDDNPDVIDDQPDLSGNNADTGTGTVIDPIVRNRVTARTDLPQTHTTREGAVMQRVTAGPFLLGSPPGVGEVDEQPQRNMVLDDYFIDTTEVTVSAFQQCVNDGVCGRNLFTGGLDQARATGRPLTQSTCNADVPGRDSFPINCVSAKAATQFCAWRSQQDALLSYRLPTEAEWEKAARGVDGRSFPWGEQVTTCSFALIGNCGAADTGAVGSTPGDVSPNGVLDMGGRVSEWVIQVYADPLDEAALARGEIQNNLRGGNWKLNSPVRGGDRDAAPVPLGDTGFGADDVGFRCIGVPR